MNKKQADEMADRIRKMTKLEDIWKVYGEIYVGYLSPDSAGLQALKDSFFMGAATTFNLIHDGYMNDDGRIIKSLEKELKKHGERNSLL